LLLVVGFAGAVPNGQDIWVGNGSVVSIIDFCPVGRGLNPSEREKRQTPTITIQELSWPQCRDGPWPLEDIFLTRKTEIEKFEIFRGNFPSPNQRWVTGPQATKYWPNLGQNFLTQTYQCHNDYENIHTLFLVIHSQLLIRTVLLNSYNIKL